MTGEVGGSLVEEQAGLSSEINKSNKHRSLLPHLQPKVSVVTLFFSPSTGPSESPSVHRRGFILEILARQRARDSCEVRSSVRKGEERDEEDVEKARREEDMELE